MSHNIWRQEIMSSGEFSFQSQNLALVFCTILAGIEDLLQPLILNIENMRVACVVAYQVRLLPVMLDPVKALGQVLLPIPLPNVHLRNELVGGRSLSLFLFLFSSLCLILSSLSPTLFLTTPFSLSVTDFQINKTFKRCLTIIVIMPLGWFGWLNNTHNLLNIVPGRTKLNKRASFILQRAILGILPILDSGNHCST